MQVFRKGQRVQLHAACDEWMQGDRYGDVLGLGHKRKYIDRWTRVPEWTRPVRVKLDSGRIRRFHPEALFLVD